MHNRSKRAALPGLSADEQFRGIEQHGDYFGSKAAMRYETMVYEANKQ